ncbi:MAG TPA: sodium:alanine symporter family protein [Myxococcota bacterium]|nr:sodium:alanine symporter family protein [Myxococcota bacterium]HRY97157.1 sodium:alanine symporter family protein [Myxococcota bacterium]
MEAIERALTQVSDFIWGWPMVILLASTHLFLTVRLGFPQRHILKGIRISFSRKREGQGDVSQFGALVTALAATIGTGNIVGVATAVAAGGPGAVLWMWLTGVFGISTKYAEGLLAVKYRVVTPQGTMAGGPMYALERGLGQRWLGLLFAAFTAVAAFGIGNMVQANSISTLAETRFAVPPWATGLVLMALTAVVILGGIKWIARACEGLVPFMVVTYVLGCGYLLAIGWETLGDSALLILQSAFSGQAAVGGFLGAGIKEAVRYGVARGLFSNESGLGSAPIVAAAAQTRDPVRQALVSSTGTFWDTVVVCAITGLVIVNSGLWQQGLKGAELTNAVFAQAGPIGTTLLVLGLFTFVFSTILGWSYYGEKAVEYLIGAKAVLPYRLLWVGAVMAGSVATMPAVWAFSDIANALMAIPNLVVLFLLSGVVARETRGYFGPKGPPGGGATSPGGS